MPDRFRRRCVSPHDGECAGQEDEGGPTGRPPSEVHRREPGLEEPGGPGIGHHGHPGGRPGQARRARNAVLAEGDKLRTDFRFRPYPIPSGDFSSETGTRWTSPTSVRVSDPNWGRSIWNDFPRLAQEGLYGGVLSTDWALLDLRKRRAKVRYRGLKKFEGKEVSRTGVQTQEGGGLQDPALLRTRDLPPRGQPATGWSVPDGMGRGLVDVAGDPARTGGIGSARAVPAAASESERSGGSRQYKTRPESSPMVRRTPKLRINLTETFSDFKEVDGLTLAVSLQDHPELRCRRLRFRRTLGDQDRPHVTQSSRSPPRPSPSNRSRESLRRKRFSAEAQGLTFHQSASEGSMGNSTEARAGSSARSRRRLSSCSTVDVCIGQQVAG